MQKIQPILETNLVDDDDLVFVRQRTKQLSELTGLSVRDQTKLVTAVSEVARNALQYARGARVLFEVRSTGTADYLTIVVKDTGAGIPSVDAVLSDSYISKTGLGKGLSGARRLVDKFEIDSSSAGTCVLLGKAVPRIITEAATSRFAKVVGEQTPRSAIEELKTQNTQLSLMLQELQTTREQLEQANRLKDEFLANVSHEIRTPMNAMIGITNILERSRLDNEQRRLLTLLKDSGRSLLNIINDILDLSKIEAGKLQLNYRAFDLIALLEAAIEMFSASALEKQLRLKLQMGPVPRFVHGEPDRLRQILLNLIGNAIKFSDKGEILITAGGKTSTGEADRIRFSVSDDGIGIAPEQTNMLFQAFTQLDGTAARKHAGTGLGLSICKRLVQIMGGTIGVDSKLGEGSTFWFELPLETAEEVIAEPPMHVPMRSFAGCRVLIAEDHAVNRMVAEHELRELSIEVDVVCNGEEAVNAISNRRYDAVLLDCQMPVMDGFEAAKAVRVLERGTRHIPIIAMTANAMSGDKEMCLSAGMDDYLSKPFEPHELREVLSRWLRPAEEHSGKMESLIDFPAMHKRFGELRAQVLIDAFLEDMAGRDRTMQQSLDDRDADTLAAEAHALKGACGIIYAKRLAATAEALEAAAKQRNWVTAAEKLSQLQQQVKRLSETKPQPA